MDNWPCAGNLYETVGERHMKMEKALEWAVLEFEHLNYLDCFADIFVRSVIIQPHLWKTERDNQWGSESQNWKRHQAVWRPDFSEKTQLEVVQACHTIIWTGQDYPTGNSSWRETKRQTEETMGRQCQRVDRPWMGYTTTESWERRGVEEAGYKIYSGAPTVSQTTG